MDDPERSRRAGRDAGLTTVSRWTRRAIAGGVVLCGLLGLGVAHLLPGQAQPQHESSTSDSGSSTTQGGGSTLTPPDSAPGSSGGDSHVTSGGS
jgi:hypothetical protein